MKRSWFVAARLTLTSSAEIWTFLSRASDPSAVKEGALLVAGHPDDPCLVRVISMTPTPDGDAIVRVDDVPARFDEVIDALEPAGLR
jgi:hypothetical protein